MRSDKLSMLNFSRLLHYSGGQPQVKNQYDPPITCTGFCISCEEKGFFAKSDKMLDLMSHGADTRDFEQILGDLPLPEQYIEVPIMFLLESPGADYENGEPVSYKGVTKRPPVKRYYWGPNPMTEWPNNPCELPQLYGPYFAYLMNKFHLKDVYITNAIKCGLSLKNKRGKFISYKIQRNSKLLDTRIRENCCREYLCREVEEFKPKVIFAFGDRADKVLYFSGLRDQGIITKKLYHPVARKPLKERVNKNNERIKSVLKDAKLL
ncbi:MAG: hypothetical protein JRI46_08030 [Deltaproteobacteria bacterium]|nr:hypothetical protein [Deltaproteobacteria bacterium]